MKDFSDDISVIAFMLCPKFTFQQCLDNLTQWKDLETIATKGIDEAPSPNLDRVWEDGFYQASVLYSFLSVKSIQVSKL